MRKLTFLTVLILAVFMSGCAARQDESEESRLPQPAPKTEEAQQSDEKDERQINLYYYNIEKDREIAEYLPCSEDAVLPVGRTIPETDTVIRDTLELLIKGSLTEKEINEGFQTEFPGPGFALENVEISNGTAVLTFSDPEGFTIGGSCRTGLLYQQIKKTALQFDEVDEVIVKPETLFQP